MRFSFLPTFRTEAVTDLTPHFLQENHIRLLLLDPGLVSRLEGLISRQEKIPGLLPGDR